MEIDNILDSLEQCKDASLFAEFEDLEDCSYSGVRQKDVESFNPVEDLDIELGITYGIR